MIEWKPLKFKHYRRLKELMAGGDITDEDVLRYAVDLVARWDFEDAETGQPLQSGDLDNLSFPQMTQLFDAFQAQFERVDGAIPKASAAPSSSTTME